MSAFAGSSQSFASREHKYRRGCWKAVQQPAKGPIPQERSHVFISVCAERWKGPCWLSLPRCPQHREGPQHHPLGCLLPGAGCIGHVELIGMLCSTAGLRTGHQLGVAVPPVDTPRCQAEKGQCPTRGRVPSASCYGPGHCMPSPESPRAAPMKDGNTPPSSHAVALAHQVVSK